MAFGSCSHAFGQLPFRSSSKWVLLFFRIRRIHLHMKSVLPWSDTHFQCCWYLRKPKILWNLLAKLCFYSYWWCCCCSNFYSIVPSFHHFQSHSTKVLQHFNEICYYYWPILLPTNWIRPFFGIDFIWVLYRASWCVSQWCGHHDNTPTDSQMMAKNVIRN